MRTRQDWSVLLAGLATLWLALVLWLSFAQSARGLDQLVIGLGLFMQVSVLMAWDLFPRLPLWIIAGHGLIMISLVPGFLITAPAAGVPAPGVLVPPVPWLVVGLLPAGLAMIAAAALRWVRSDGLVH
jgi:hypothetical protein